jgi:hypothetical protein
MVHGEAVATVSYPGYEDLVLDFSPPMTVSSSGAQILGQGVARLNGSVSAEATVTIYWDVADHGTNASAWAQSASPGTVSAGSFHADASNLLYGLTFHYRCFASNAVNGSTAWSSAASFALPLPGSPVAVVNSGSIRAPASKLATLSFTAGAASKLVVAVSSENSGEGTTAVTYNGAPLTLAAPGSGRMAGIWYLDNPYGGGAANLIVDMTSYATVNGIGVGAVSLSGTAPGVVTNAVNTTNTVTIATTVSNSFVMAGYGKNGGVAVSAAAPLTQVYAGDINSAMGSAGYHLVAAAGTNTYTFTSTDHLEAVTVAAVFSPFMADVSTLDANQDGIADAWAVYYFAEDPFTAGLATSDPDGDGFSNHEEYIAGTVPTNALDFAAISIVASNGALHVSIPSRLTTSGMYGSLGRYYSLVSTTNLLVPDWPPVAGAEEMPATGGELLHTIPPGDANRFYRAKVWLGEE